MLQVAESHLQEIDVSWVEGDEFNDEAIPVIIRLNRELSQAVCKVLWMEWGVPLHLERVDFGFTWSIPDTPENQSKLKWMRPQLEVNIARIVKAVDTYAPLIVRGVLTMEEVLSGRADKEAGRRTGGDIPSARDDDQASDVPNAGHGPSDDGSVRSGPVGSEPGNGLDEVEILE